MHSEPEANVYRDEANRVIVVTDGITKTPILAGAVASDLHGRKLGFADAG